ncbi:hypothetical protein GCM10019016_036330 [Streptomyces prasinosporus]|uniref:Uncharacterized protein n=1 Tax=Streptomyces prasinosporus TaxID=68256 RepID=A0ABP6TNE5_9ACTN
MRAGERVRRGVVLAGGGSCVPGGGADVVEVLIARASRTDDAEPKLSTSYRNFAATYEEQ